jgi:hypothetical protein
MGRWGPASASKEKYRTSVGCVVTLAPEGQAILLVCQTVRPDRDTGDMAREVTCERTRSAVDQKGEQ